MCVAGPSRSPGLAFQGDLTLREAAFSSGGPRVPVQGEWGDGVGRVAEVPDLWPKKDVVRQEVVLTRAGLSAQ